TIGEDLNDISELAESWGVQDNGNVYVFQLLKGVEFHDGSDIEAAAVAWNFERIMEKEEQAFLPVRTHIVDTHGYTDQLFGLCDLLGFAFMPRLKKLSGQRLFKPVGLPEERLFGSRAHPQLDPLFSGTVNLNLIADQWD